MTLEVAVCTINGSLAHVPDILLPEREDVTYLVAWQCTDVSFASLATDSRLLRKDVRLVKTDSTGLARNRNVALEHATGDILLIADDDVRYEDIYFDRIIRTFQDYPSLDIACFQACSYDGKSLRDYASHTFAYADQPRGTYFISFEIALRRSAGIPSFDERFGLGAPFLGAGEEEVFLWQAHRHGLNIQYFPTVVVRTDPQTTGDRMSNDAGVQRAKGAVLCLMHGPVGAWLRCLKYVLYTSPFPHRFSALREMTRGIKYISQCRS